MQLAWTVLIVCGGLALLLLAGCGALIFVKTRSHSDCAAKIEALKTDFEKARMRVWRSVDKQLKRAGGVDFDEQDAAGPPLSPAAPAVTDVASARAALRARLESGRKVGNNRGG